MSSARAPLKTSSSNRCHGRIEHGGDHQSASKEKTLFCWFDLLKPVDVFHAICLLSTSKKRRMDGFKPTYFEYIYIYTHIYIYIYIYIYMRPLFQSTFSAESDEMR